MDFSFHNHNTYCCQELLSQLPGLEVSSAPWLQINSIDESYNSKAKERGKESRKTLCLGFKRVASKTEERKREKKVAPRRAPPKNSFLCVTLTMDFVSSRRLLSCRCRRRSRNAIIVRQNPSWSVAAVLLDRSGVHEILLLEK